MPRAGTGQKKRKPARRDDFVHFRVEPEFTALLDAEAKRLGTTRSGAARILLANGLGADLATARARQAVYDMSGAVREATRDLMDEMVKKLPAAIMRALDGSVEVGSLEREIEAE